MRRLKMMSRDVRFGLIWFGMKQLFQTLEYPERKKVFFGVG